jgi:hypothetical protein
MGTKNLDMEGMAMRSFIASWISRLKILAAGAALTVAPVFGAQAAECLIAAEVPEHLTGKPSAGLHAAPHLRPEETLAAPHTATHGQIALGKNAPRFLYHLPVFMGDPWHHPHNFQVVLAVSPLDEADAATARYAQDRAQHPDGLYTAVPPVFDQTALVYAYRGGEPLRQLDGVALFRGHFENPADRHLLTRDANLAIERVVYFNEFDPTGETSSTLGYLLFGQGDERFMVHVLSGPPDFDQILEVAVEGDALPQERLGQGVFVAFVERSNQVEERLVAGEAVSCTMADEAVGTMPDVTLRVIAEHYCEVGELAHTVGQLAGNDFGTPRACPPR